MASDLGNLSESELNTLIGSSGDDVDMALVDCVVRELRRLRAQLAAMAPVVSLAEMVRDLDEAAIGMANGITTTYRPLYDAVADMYAAIDTYRAAQAQETST